MKNITLDFIKGILYTYADLNTPDSNLSYKYEIIEMELEKDESIFLENQFQLPEECLFTIEDINFEEFQKSLNNWFFKNGEISNLQIDERREDNYIELFFNNLNDLIYIKNIKTVEFSYANEAYYELGIYYEYFFIEGDKNKYLVYFKYED
ncbi:hypothetical protein ASG22_03615 [Chryseobacterium sp. Leaf405]|uniref:hypothetical protein n=1 Tax=Chryseobacterium sp. Leaf405 TaxID=1736367 RepID=UPI0006F6FEC6|nr:hypothetical protein [Chryseobacterium sp. Leaf405]KQT25804.1 hypothetical protein ASG22_03615 [Chryseobacterium sp. Leaf405]